MLVLCGRRCVPSALPCLQKPLQLPCAAAAGCFSRHQGAPRVELRFAGGPSSQLRCIANASKAYATVEDSGAQARDPVGDELQALVLSNTTSAGDLFAELLRTKYKLSRWDPAARRAECKRLQLGARVLLWLWNKRQTSGSSKVLEEDFADVLAWFLLPEGNEEYVWEWIHTEITTLAGQEYREHMRWSLRLLAGLAQAHSAWADDGSPDPAILCFKRAVETLPPDRQDRRVPLVGMYVVLSKLIQRLSCPVHSPVLFEWFCRNLRHAHPDQYKREQREVRLAVWHPTRPDAQPLVQWILRDWPVNQIWHVNQSALRSLGKDLLRASYILRQQGRTSQADGLDLIVRTKIPVTWTDRVRLHLLKAFKNDRRLDSVRQGTAES